MFDEGTEIGLPTWAFERFPVESIVNAKTEVWVSIDVTEYENSDAHRPCNPSCNQQESANCFRQMIEDHLFDQTFGMKECKGTFGNCSIPQVVMMSVCTFNYFSFIFVSL